MNLGRRAYFFSMVEFYLIRGSSWSVLAGNSS